jgi:hypothetical protein
VATVLEDFDNAPDERVPVPSELARIRIVDQYGILADGYGVFSGFLVKL